MSYRDYYEVLGIARAASQDDVQKAYKKLARKWHPDVNREKDAEDRFKAINEAYEVLKDPKKRELYDKYGQAWKAISEGRQPPPGMENMQFDFRNMDGWTGGMDPSDLQSVFEQFFAGRRGRGGPQQRRARRGPVRGSDLESRIELGVEEGARGGTREIGIHDPSTGQVSRVSLKVPAGVRAGQRIRLAGKGGTGSEGAEAGDLYLQVELVDDARYRIEEDGIYTTVQITPWEAALGATVAIPTLDGEVRVKIPAGTSSGKNIRLRGKGYPQADGTRGDLYATVQIVVPDSLSSRERELFEQLRDASSFRARAE